jgi:hypothetical protein
MSNVKLMNRISLIKMAKVEWVKLKVNLWAFWIVQIVVMILTVSS